MLDAIARARVADKRMSLTVSLVDEIGRQMAHQAILFNLLVISDAVQAMPEEVLQQDPDLPWAELAAMRELLGEPFRPIAPEVLHRTVEVDLSALEVSVRRLQAMQ